MSASIIPHRPIVSPEQWLAEPHGPRRQRPTDAGLHAKASSPGGMTLLLSSTGGDDAVGTPVQELHLPIAQIYSIEQARRVSRRTCGVGPLLASGVRRRRLHLAPGEQRRKALAAAQSPIARLATRGELGGDLRLEFADRLVVVRKPSLPIQLCDDLRRFPQNEIVPRLTPTRRGKSFPPGFLMEMRGD